MYKLLSVLMILMSAVSGNIYTDTYTNTYTYSQATALGTVEQKKIDVLEKPSFEYYKSSAEEKSRYESLILTKEKAIEDQIIALDKWFYDNYFWPNVYVYNTCFITIFDPTPYFVRDNYQGQVLRQAIYDEKYTYALYNNQGGKYSYLIIYDSISGKEEKVLDFTSYSFPEGAMEEERTMQVVNWMSIEDQVLYVSNSHGGYAEESDNINGFITAIDLNDNSVIWRSEALVCNSGNFEIVGDTIISGYGFTAEKDYIYLIDKYNGQVYEEIPVKTSPEFFIVEGNKLHVKTYDTIYEFGIEKS